MARVLFLISAFFVSGMWCWFWLEYTWFWVGFMILPWIHLILSWFCNFVLNTLYSELVLCWCLIYQNAGYCFWYQLYCLWHYTLFYTSVVSWLWVNWTNQKCQSRKISCFNLTTLFLVKFATKMSYVWQGVMLCVLWHLAFIMIIRSEIISAFSWTVLPTRGLSKKLPKVHNVVTYLGCMISNTVIIYLNLIGLWPLQLTSPVQPDARIHILYS